MDAQKKVLLIDDDSDFLEITRRLLEASGYCVFCAATPQEASQEMARRKPDLIITDLMMSRLDSGFSICRKVRNAPEFRGVPIIVVSAIAARRGFDFKPHTPEDLQAMCADAYFEKPLPPDELLAKVAELLQKPAKESPS